MKQFANLLKEHKYKCNCLSVVYNHGWSPLLNRFVKYVPKWIHPNLITSIGGVFVLLGVFVPYVTLSLGIADQYTYYFAAFCIFASSFMDNLDGKQARRTNTSSSFGAILDHTIDGMSSVVFPLVMYILLKQTVKLDTDFILFAVAAWYGFYTTAVNEHHTGIFELGYISPDEIMIVQIISLTYVGYTNCMVIGSIIHYASIVMTIFALVTIRSGGGFRSTLKLSGPFIVLVLALVNTRDDISILRYIIIGVSFVYIQHKMLLGNIIHHIDIRKLYLVTIPTFILSYLNVSVPMIAYSVYICILIIVSFREIYAADCVQFLSISA